MKVVILAGGLGTRLVEETSVRLKPMVEIGRLLFCGVWQPRDTLRDLVRRAIRRRVGEGLLLRTAPATAMTGRSREEKRGAGVSALVVIGSDVESLRRKDRR
jgi:hypothetical protein